MRYFNVYPSRTLCDVLNDMRNCDKTKNYAMLLSLIEEAQIMGNRMEAGLEDKNDIERLRSERKKLNKEIKELQEVVDDAKSCES